MKKLIALMLAYIMVFGTYVSLGVSAYAASYKVGSVSLSKTTYVYNGKAKKPKVVVKDSRKQTIPAKGNYTVKYPKNACVGSKNVTITFKGKYKHNKTVKKKIKVIPQITTIKDIKPKVGGFFVKWKKVAKEVTGYQVQYSTNKSFPQKGSKTLTVKGNSTFTKEVKGLPEGKKYFVRVRAYKTFKKKNYYSYWKNTKTVTTGKKITYTVLVPNKLRLGSDGMYQIVDEKGKWIGIDRYYAGDYNGSDNDERVSACGHRVENGPFWTEYKTKSNGECIYEYKDGVEQCIKTKPYITCVEEIKEYYRLVYNTYKTMEITDNMSDYEKFIRISKWFSENVKYAFKSDGKGGKIPDMRYALARSAIIDKKTVCSGYTALTEDFCYLADIDCFFLYDKTHAWNAIKLNGYWYRNDMTNANVYWHHVNPGSCNYDLMVKTITSYPYTDEELELEKEEKKELIYNRSFSVPRTETYTNIWESCNPKGNSDTFKNDFELFQEAIRKFRTV